MTAMHFFPCHGFLLQHGVIELSPARQSLKKRGGGFVWNVTIQLSMSEYRRSHTFRSTKGVTALIKGTFHPCQNSSYIDYFPPSHFLAIRSPKLDFIFDEMFL